MNFGSCLSENGIVAQCATEVASAVSSAVTSRMREMRTNSGRGAKTTSPWSWSDWISPRVEMSSLTSCSRRMKNRFRFSMAAVQRFSHRPCLRLAGVKAAGSFLRNMTVRRWRRGFSNRFRSSIGRSRRRAILVQHHQPFAVRGSGQSCPEFRFRSVAETSELVSIFMPADATTETYKSTYGLRIFANRF